ncbi:gastrula zinc finger protein XlCGF57.1-like isoform X4 [Dreissena polymorpha]|nr:gastrula zinc finger protein XlCGF57.1-like isoform X4 [Dreissena polymorpha]
MVDYSIADNCTQHFEEYIEGNDIHNSHSIVIEQADRGKFTENHEDHLSHNSVIVMSSEVGGEGFMVENTEDDVELGEIEYIQDGDIITISEGNTSSSFTHIVSKSQYENICNTTTTHGYQMTSDSKHGNYITSEVNQIIIDCNQATTESNHATYAGYQITSDGHQATAESNHATNVGYQVTIDGNQATSNCNQSNTNSNLAALETSMVTTNWTHGVIIDNAGPENHACDDGSGYLDGETLHVSLKGGTGQSLTLINKRRLEQMTQGSEVLVVEPKKSSHQCYICQAEFTQITELYRHRVTHNEAASSMFKCNTCNLTFREPLDLEKHRQLHLDRRVYKCCICQDTFSDLYNFRCHLRIHDKIATYTCDMCPFMVFGERKQYISHLEDHELAKDSYIPGHTLRLPCFVCKKDFPDRASLRKHQNYYHSEKCFKCALCGKAFVERAKLQRHQITHTGKKEFQCTYCDKSFGLKHNLLAHMNIHTKYKPWECSICRRKFGQKVCLNRHLKVHEGFSVEYL